MMEIMKICRFECG